MDVKLILLPFLLVAMAGASGSPEEGCLSRTDFITSTLQDEIDMWICRHGKDVIVTVKHSEGSCELRIYYSDLDEQWLRAKLSLKDTIVLFVNGIPISPRSGCARSLKINTIKTVTIDNAKHLLPDCRQGPAIYQISKDLGDVLIPWYEDEAQLVLEPQDDTPIRIEVGGQEFVVCSNGTHVAAQRNASACTDEAETSNITLVIPKSNKVIKVITADGKEAETQINNGAADVPPKVKKTLISGTVIIKQCMPECKTGLIELQKASLLDQTAEDIRQCKSGQGNPDDCSCTVYYLALMVIFLVTSVGLAVAVAYLVVFRGRGYVRPSGKEDFTQQNF